MVPYTSIPYLTALDWAREPSVAAGQHRTRLLEYSTPARAACAGRSPVAAAPPEQPTDAKPQEGGPPPPPDMEELVEDIEYEARVDRDVSGVVDTVRDALEDHGKTILDHSLQ